jgi:hypothetical protein
MIYPNGKVALPLLPCIPGNLVTVPESLTDHLTAIELRLRALEEAIKERQPQDDAESIHQSSDTLWSQLEAELAGSDAPTDTLKGLEGSLWSQMYEDAAEASGECSDATGKDGAAMIRAVAAWIEKWASSSQIDTDQLLRALDAEAQAARVEG